MAAENALLRVENLRKYYPVTSGILRRTVGYVRAVDNVSFSLMTGETLGVVGESGCGKSTLAMVLLRLVEPTAGKAMLNGRNIFELSGRDLQQFRRNLQVIFQDPYSSLNPRMKVGSIIGESIDVHRVARGREKKERVVDLLERVGLSAKHFDRYPHEFSGGQRQRIGVARALAITPKIIVCDEPVSALDVSIQAQVINLLQDVQEDFGLTYIFISHNLNVVKHISDRVVVMYLGQIVELTSRDELYSNPLHPYSKALLSAVPIADPDINKEEIVLTGDVPSPVNPPPGCRFHPRCFAKGDICSRDEPELKTLRSGHAVACHYSKDDDCKR